MAAVLLAAALAGCIGSDGGSAETASDPGPATAGDGDATVPSNETGASAPNETEEDANPLGTLPDGSPVPAQTTLAGCHEQIGVFPVPDRLVGTSTPEGFETASFGPLGETATLVVLSLSCTVDGEDHGETWAMVEVEPPEEMASDEADFSLLVLGAITSSEDQTATYRAWGLGDDVLDGDVTVEALHEAGPTRSGHVLATDGDFTVHVYSGVGGEASPEEAGNARVFGAEDGEVTGIVDVAWTDAQGGYETGEATLAVEGGTPAPIPQPQGAGIAVHTWGEDYDITYTYTPLET